MIIFIQQFKIFEFHPLVDLLLRNMHRSHRFNKQIKEVPVKFPCDPANFFLRFFGKCISEILKCGFFSVSQEVVANDKHYVGKNVLDSDRKPGKEPNKSEVDIETDC